jgi:hypothetical protein
VVVIAAIDSLVTIALAIGGLIVVLLKIEKI